MRQRLIYLVKTYLLTILLFVIAKIAFMLLNHEGHSFTVKDMVDVIWHGLTLDLSTSLYLLIIPFLITIVSIWWESKLLIKILRFYYSIIAFALILAFVTDTSLYPFWGFKLDATCLQYLETPAEAKASVSGLYMAIRIIILMIGTVLIYRLYKSIPYETKLPSHKSAVLIGDLVLIPLFIIGIRGGLGESTTNIGQVYYSQDQFLNHSAVNPVFSFLYSLSHTMGNVDQYQFMDDNECYTLTNTVYTTESMLTDTLLTTSRPNVVVILLESCGEQFRNVMPYLQKLKREGIWFSNCYANSWRTDRGTIATLSGYPSFPSLSVMKMPQKSRTLPSIARSLQKEGYKTSYLYGGDINFTNMRGYLISTGWEQLRWKDDYSKEEQGTAQWGVRDDITFGTLLHMIKETPTPYLIGYSTLSSHEPWDVPTKKHTDEVQNAFAYLDDCLENFIESLRQTPAWDNLLVIMVADHGVNHHDIDQSKPLLKNHIPMLWVGGAVREPRILEYICNQTDLAATLLGQMQLSHDDFAFSRDIMSSTYHYPTAVNNYNNAQLLIDSTGYILYDFDARQFSIRQSSDADRLQRLNQAILQRTTNDLKVR